MNKSDFSRVLSTLKNVTPNKPWMTAKRITSQCQLSTAATASLLHQHFDGCKTFGERPKARYSNLPSKRTLEILWGATCKDKVGARSVKPITRTDVEDRSLGDVSGGPGAVFLSHSLNDYDSVIELAKCLSSRNLAPWLAETHISQGEVINLSIIEALGNARAFLLFLTENSLASRWTGKGLSLIHI